MSVEEAYHVFTEKVNRNSINDNIMVDRSRFISLFNEAQIRFVEWILEKRNEDDIRHIQRLMVCDKVLKSKGEKKNHKDFQWL